MISHFFIDRPIFATVLSIVFVIVGGVALTQLPIAQYPDVAPPTVQVTATYPGANAKTVADTVATPIEQEVNGVDKMIYMKSSNTSDGRMQLDVNFKVGTDQDMANVLTQNRVSSAQARLPQEVVQQNSSRPSAERYLISCALEKFWPRKCEVPDCSALRSCIMASML